MKDDRKHPAVRMIAGGVVGASLGFAGAALIRKQRNKLLDRASHKLWMQNKLFGGAHPIIARKMGVSGAQKLLHDANLMDEFSAQLPYGTTAAGATFASIQKEKKAREERGDRSGVAAATLGGGVGLAAGLIGAAKSRKYRNKLLKQHSAGEWVRSKRGGWLVAPKHKQTARKSDADLANMAAVQLPVGGVTVGAAGGTLANQARTRGKSKKEKDAEIIKEGRKKLPKVFTKKMRKKLGFPKVGEEKQAMKSTHRVNQAVLELQRKFDALRKEDHQLPWRTDHGRYVEKNVSIAEMAKSASVSDSCAVAALQCTGTLVKEAAVALTESGHAYQRSKGKITERVHERMRKANLEYAADQPLLANFGDQHVNAILHNLISRHGAYKARKHKKKKQSLNPFGGWLTPTEAQNLERAARKKEKTAAIAFTRAGHRLEAERGKAMEEHGTGVRRAADRYAKEQPLSALLLGHHVEALGGRLQARYGSYAKKKHGKKRMALNPFGGLLTPTEAENLERALRKKEKTKKASVTWYEERITVPAGLYGIEKGAVSAASVAGMMGAAEEAAKKGLSTVRKSSGRAGKVKTPAQVTAQKRRIRRLAREGAAETASPQQAARMERIRDVASTRLPGSPLRGGQVHPGREISPSWESPGQLRAAANPQVTSGSLLQRMGLRRPPGRLTQYAPNPALAVGPGGMPLV